MQVGQLITQLVTTYDGTGFNKFQSDLLRGVSGANAAAKQFDAFNKALEKMRQSTDAGTRGIGYIISALNLLSPEIDRVIRVAGGLSSILGTIGKGAVAGLSGIGGVVKSLIDPITTFVTRTLSVLNPLNLINSTIQTAGRVGEIAFGVLIGNALTELTQKAIGFVSALAPLQTGIFAGEIGTQLKALAVTAANAGLSFEQVRGSVNGVRILGIEASEAIKSISQGFQVGLNPSQIQELARAAQDMAVVIGTNSSEAFNRLFQAIVSGNSELLRFAGIMKTQDQIIQDFSRTSGKSVSEIRGNVNLLRQAFFQGIIQEAKQFAGAYEASLEELGKRLSSFPRTFNDLRLGIGRIFEPFLAGAFSVVEETTESLSRLFFVTKRGALENAASTISSAAGIQLNAKQLSELQIAAIKGGDAMETTFAKIAAATGTPVEKLKELAAAGAFSSDAIAKIGKAFEPTELTNQLRGLAYAVGSIVQGLAKSAFAFLNGGQAAVQSAIPQMVTNGIQMVANFALGILTGITQYVIPAAINIITALTQVLAGGTVALATSGATLASSLLAGMMSGVASGLASFGSVIGSVLQSVLGGFANGLLFLGDVKNWGKDIPGAAAAGVNQGKFDLMAVLEEIRKAAMASFANDTGPADIIGNWGRGIVRSVLESLKLRDFTALSFLEGIIKSIFGQGSEKQAVIAVNAVAQALADLNATGAISASSLTALGAAFGAAFGDVQKYLAAVNEMNIGLDKQEQLENDVEDATDAVQAAQDRLRQFEADSAGIPERYTRGRRAQLQAELDAAQKEQEKKRDALRDQQKANEKTREALDLQRALIQELVRAAETQAKINADAANQRPDVADVPLSDIDAQLKRIGNDFRAQILSAFKPVQEQFTILGTIIRSALGLEVKLPPKPQRSDFQTDNEFQQALLAYDQQVALISSAKNKGTDLRDVLSNLGTVVVPKIQTAFEQVKKVISDIYELAKKIAEVVGGFVAALTGGSVAPGSQDTGRTAGSRDPKATENAGALAGFSAGQDLITISQQTMTGLQELGKVIAQLSAFASANPTGAKLIAGATIATILAPGLVVSLATTLLGIGVKLGGALVTGLVGAVTGEGLAGALTIGLGESVVAAVTGLAAIVAAPEFLVGFLAALGAAFVAAMTLGSAAIGYSIASALAEAIGNSLGFDVDFPGVSESLTKLSDAFKTGGLPKMLEVAGALAQQLGDAFGTSFEALKTGLSTALVAAFKTIFDPVLASIDAYLTAPNDSVLGKIRATVDSIASIFTGSENTISLAVDNIGKAIVAVFSGVYTTLVGASIVPDTINAIVALFTGMAGLLTAPLQAVADAIVSPFASAAESAKGFIASITGQPVSQSNSSPAPQSNSKPVQSNGTSKPAINPVVQDNTAVTLDQINAALAGSPAASTAENNITKPITTHFTNLNRQVGDEQVPSMSKKVQASLVDLGTKSGALATTTANNISQPIEAMNGRVKTAIQTASKEVVANVQDMLKPTVDLKNAFNLLGTTAQTVMRNVAGAVSSNLTNIKTNVQEISKEVVRLIDDIQKAFQKLGQGPVLKAVGDLMKTMLEMFRKLFDQLVGHSIVPDLVDGIVGEFEDLNPRTKNPLFKFTTGVENVVAGIDGKMKLSNKGLTGGKGGREHVEINVNQTGWVFPATMDAGQQETLRRLAREEAYTGITLAFNKAGTI